MSTILHQSTMAPNVPMDRDERVRRFGIECIGPAGDGILFKAGTWRPGGEYIQKLIIRNVSTQVKKLKYKLPSTRYFSMAYPEPIVLSPGLSQEVDVVFRPVEYEPYDDTIYIKMLDGMSSNGFHIPVRATIDKLSLVAPDGLDLGYCPTHQTSYLKFKLVNDGEIDAPYEWEVPEPFIFKPSSGVVPVGQYHEITISIMPTDASVYVAKAVCKVGTGVHAIIPNPILVSKLSAIGKFTYITLSDSMISFDEVVSGMIPDKKEIVLYNNSVVPAEFELIRFDNDRDEVFEIEPKLGIIPPRSEVPVTIRFTSLAMGCYSQDRYAYRTPSNCNTVLTVKGLSMPPKVSLYKDIQPGQLQTSTQQLIASQGSSFMMEEGAPLFSLNFRDVEVGRVETRVLFLSNESEREVAYCIMADEQGIFKMTPKQGIIPPLIKQFAVKVIFTPPKPINYYRRFFVLVGDALPLFYDCMGTGFIRAKGEVKEQRPAPIRHAHVQAYRNRVVQGLGLLNPDELDQMYENEDVPRDFFAQIGRTGTKAMSVTTLQKPVTRTGDTIRNLVAPAHEFFIENTDMTAKEIVLSKTTLDFGYTSHHDTSASQVVVLHNNTHGKITVLWHIPMVKGMMIKEHVRSSREQEVITQDRAEKELAELQAFSIFPITADINAGQSATFNITFCPKQSSRNFLTELEGYVFYKNQRTFRLVNDYSLVPPWCLTVAAMGHTFSTGQLLAKAKFYGGNLRNGKLVFPCCFYGESIYQTVMLRNSSNLPCTFSIDLGWSMESHTVVEGNRNLDNSVFKVKPNVGEIAEDGFILICIRFTPQALKKYTELARLIVNGEECGKLLLEGAGAVPYLTVTDLLESKADYPEQVWGLPNSFPKSIPTGKIGQLFMKPTSLGLQNSRKVTLKNASRLPLRFKVSLPYEANEIMVVQPAVGVLRGNDDIQLTVTFSPKNVELYTFPLHVEVFPIGGKGQRVMDANQPGPVEPPELLQEFSVDIVAQGEVGALTFDPSDTVVDVILVHKKQEKDIWLENVSDSEISYQLFYKEVFLPDTVDEEAVEKESDLLPLVDFMSQGSPSKSQMVTKKGGSPGFEHSLFCEQHKGRIGARSRTRLVFTYRPVKSGLFHFYIFAQIQALDYESKQIISIANNEAALMRLSGNDPSQMKTFADSVAMLPLSASIEARAAFPKLLFEDIRTDLDTQISDLEYLWNRFSFPGLNHDLSVPLCLSELALYNSSSPDLSQLHVYPFEFAPAVQHSPVQTITIQLKNHGYLETKFALQLPNEKTLELENWCDEDEPSEELNRLICIIEELKLFSIEPKQAVLQPGETCLLTISYKHSTMKYNGIHNLPVLVRIAQGKQFYLDLRGRTLAPAVARRQSVKILDPKASTTSFSARGGNNTPSHRISTTPDILLVIGAARQDKKIILSPVPIGLSYENTYGNAVLFGTKLDSAPMQRIELINVSAHTVQYEVFIGDAPEEPQTINDLYILKNNFYLDLFKITNRTGSINANSSVFLEAYVYPVEVKEYTFPIIVKYTTDTFALFNPSPSMAGDVSVVSRGSQSRRSNSKRSKREDTPSINTNTPAAPVVQYLQHTVVVTAYDPREPKPIVYESTYIGGQPPARPVLEHKPVFLFEDVVDFGPMPQRSVVHRILTIVNTSTSLYEFAIDETSCLLCFEGLLNVQPIFGSVQPNSKVCVNLTFTSYAQCRVVEEKLKVMLKEVVKTANKSRGGARQQLIDKLKARKSVNTPHESVVSRPTFSRSIHVVLQEHAALLDAEEEVETDPSSKTLLLLQHLAEEEAGGEGGEKGKGRGKYPTTLNPKGEVVHAQPLDYLMKNIPALSSPGGTNILTLPSAGEEEKSSPPYPTSSNTSLAENSRSSRKLDSQMSRKLESGGTSRSGLTTSRFSTGATPHTGRETAAPRIGKTFFLLLRLKGEVFSPDTIHQLYHREERGDKRVFSPLNAFVLPLSEVFLPPIEKRYFDEEYRAEQRRVEEKSRVNIAFILERDGELRGVSSFVMERLFSTLLSQEGVRERVEESLEEKCLSEVQLRQRPSLSPFPLSGSKGRYGVYLEEVREAPPLHYAVQRELRHLGYLPSLPSLSEEEASSPLLPLLSSAEKYEREGESLPLEQWREALRAWGLEREEEIAKACEALEQEAVVNHRGSFSSSTASFLFPSPPVSLRPFLYERLSPRGRRALRQGVERAHRQRTDRKEGRGESKAVEGGGEKEREEKGHLSPPLSPSSPPSPSPSSPSLSDPLLAVVQGEGGQDFPPLAAHALSALLFDLLQQLVQPPREDGDGGEAGLGFTWGEM